MAKAEFINNFRTARNLFVHGPIRAGSSGGPAAATDQGFARTAIWFTPKSVAGFDASDFKELSDPNRAILENAVDDFLIAIRKVTPGNVPTAAQLADAMLPFTQLMKILDPYMFYPDEVAAVEKGLGMLLPLPDWIVNWDFELKADADDAPAVYLTLYVDETQAPLKDLGKEAATLTSKLRGILRVNGLKRWPYVRFQGVAEHKVG
jgi:hypothetical protein